jgi:hypothetical protein
VAPLSVCIPLEESTAPSPLIPASSSVPDVEPDPLEEWLELDPVVDPVPPLAPPELEASLEPCSGPGP